MKQLDPRLFGTAVRTRALIAIAQLEQSYPREIARAADIPLMSAQRIVNDLERQGVLASRMRGSQREVRLNPSYFAASELRALLMRLSAADRPLVHKIESIRRRPRRARKEL